MGTLFSALHIGRSGLFVSQVQLNVAGHNIANVNTEGYSRQRVTVVAQAPNLTAYGALGRGATVAGVERLRDASLDTVFRSQVPGLGSAEVRAEYYTQLENVFLEPTDNGFSTQLSAFFDALNDFAVNVEELPVRVSLLSEAEALASSLRNVAERLETLRTNTNEEVRNLVPEINSLAEQIASLNTAIQQAETGGVSANDLRDTRDGLIDDLAQLVKITARERDTGQVDILLGGDELVSGRRAFLLETVETDPNQPGLLQVQWEETGQPATILDGELYGVLQIRDVELPAVQERMDAVAHALIESLNRIHSQGSGLENYGLSRFSANAVSSKYLPLSDAGLPATVADGSFDVEVYDDQGAWVETITVAIDADVTTLADVEQAINNSSSLSGTVDTAGYLTISPDSGYRFALSNDTSGLLEALGMHALASTNAVSDPTVPLTDAGLPFEISDGAVNLVVYDSTGAAVDTITFNITATGISSGRTTLEDVAQAIDTSSYMSAAVDANGYLLLSPEGAYTFSFSEDGAGVLTALGVNGLFTGTDASSIAVNPHLLDNPSLLSSAESIETLDTGDNTAALEMAAVRTARILEGNAQTTSEYYEATVVLVGINARTNAEDLAVQQAFIRDFDTRRQEVSGVNLDEEVSSLILYQRAFEASARVISIVDSMLQTLVNMTA